MNTVVSTLTKDGHNLIQWTPYKHDYAVDMINGIYAADGSTVSTITPRSPPYQVILKPKRTCTAT